MRVPAAEYGSGIFGAVEVTVRPELAAAHDRAWQSLAEAGTWWSARQRRELAETAITAMWAGADTAVRTREGVPTEAPLAAHRAVAAMASGTPAITREWWESTRDAVGALEYVELVGLVCVVASVTSLQNTLGMPPRGLPAASGDGPTKVAPPGLADATLNWVPVAAPADANAAVVQALTAVPAANEMLWSLADVQYIPDAEMVDPRWTRGTLSRVEMELVATRVSFSRECHY